MSFINWSVEKKGIAIFIAQPSTTNREYLLPLFQQVKKTDMLLIIRPHPRVSDISIFRRLANEVGIAIAIIRS